MCSVISRLYPARVFQVSSSPFIHSRSQLLVPPSVASTFNTMATTAHRQRFLIHAPDKTEEGTLEKRLQVRPKHVESAMNNFKGGLVRVGGALLTQESVASPDAPKKMIGSVFICEADNIEQVWEMVKKDIYYTSGVWDTEKLTVLPFNIATPFNLGPA